MADASPMNAHFPRTPYQFTETFLPYSPQAPLSPLDRFEYFQEASPILCTKL